MIRAYNKRSYYTLKTKVKYSIYKQILNRKNFFFCVLGVITSNMTSGYLRKTFLIIQVYISAKKYFFFSPCSLCLQWHVIMKQASLKLIRKKMKLVSPDFYFLWIRLNKCWNLSLMTPDRYMEVVQWWRRCILLSKMKIYLKCLAGD